MKRSKRIVLNLCMPEVIEMIESLPRGYRSLAVESALVAYMETSAGKNLLNQLRHRSRKYKGRKPAKTGRRENVYKKLKGDFD